MSNQNNNSNIFNYILYIVITGTFIMLCEAQQASKVPKVIQIYFNNPDPQQQTQQPDVSHQDSTIGIHIDKINNLQEVRSAVETIVNGYAGSKGLASKLADMVMQVSMLKGIQEKGGVDGLAQQIQGDPNIVNNQEQQYSQDYMADQIHDYAIVQNIDDSNNIQYESQNININHLNANSNSFDTSTSNQMLQQHLQQNLNRQGLQNSQMQQIQNQLPQILTNNLQQQLQMNQNTNSNNSINDIDIHNNINIIENNIDSNNNINGNNNDNIDTFDSNQVTFVDDNN